MSDNCATAEPLPIAAPMKWIRPRESVIVLLTRNDVLRVPHVGKIIALRLLVADAFRPTSTGTRREGLDLLRTTS